MSTTALPSISLVTLRKTLSDVISKVSYTHERTTISKNGKPVVAIIPSEDLELLEFFEDQADLRALREAIAEDGDSGITLEDYLNGKSS